MKKRGCKYHSVGWVRDRIMTVEDVGENLLVRFTAALHPDHADEVERRMEEANMSEEGYYHFPTGRPSAGHSRKSRSTRSRRAATLLWNMRQ